jgi:uncharacterized membrane protein
MKKSDYLIITGLVTGIVIGAFIKGYLGGAISGVFFLYCIFFIAGTIAKNKIKKKMEVTEQEWRDRIAEMNDQLNSLQK